MEPSEDTTNIESLIVGLTSKSKTGNGSFVLYRAEFSSITVFFLYSERGVDDRLLHK